MFNLAIIKHHPYATGTVVIVGGLVVFYILSSSGGASGSTPTMAYGSGTTAADAQIAGVNAAAAVQTNAQQVQLQQQQLEAQVANNQTDASLHINDVNTSASLAATLAQIQASIIGNRDSLDAQTTQNRDTLTAHTVDTANQYTYAENLQSMQNDVLEANINAGVIENANNNATALAGYKLNVDASTILGTTALDHAAELASQSSSQQYDLDKGILTYTTSTGLANTPNRDNLNATAAILQTLASGGNPGVAATGVSSTAAVGVSGNNAGASKFASLVNGITSIVSGLLG